MRGPPLAPTVPRLTEGPSLCRQGLRPRPLVPPGSIEGPVPLGTSVLGSPVGPGVPEVVRGGPVARAPRVVRGPLPPPVPSLVPRTTRVDPVTGSTPTGTEEPESPQGPLGVPLRVARPLGRPSPRTPSGRSRLPRSRPLAGGPRPPLGVVRRRLVRLGLVSGCRPLSRGQGDARRPVSCPLCRTPSGGRPPGRAPGPQVWADPEPPRGRA